MLYQNSISPDIYLSWTLSVPSFRKIKETFLSGAREVAHKYHIIFFYKEILFKIVPLKFYKGIPIWIDRGPPTVNFTKEFPLILTRVHFTKNSLGIFFYREIPLLFFPTSKFEIEFHSHKKVVSPKLENSAHLFFVNFKCAKFQKN